MPKVIIVDDQDTVLKVLRTLLEGAGHDVTSFESGTNAREALEKDEYDLLVSDIRLGPESGLDLLHFARQHSPSMPVILVTAYPATETAMEAMKAGAFDYVTKPFKLDVFVNIITLALEHRRALTEDYVPAPDVETSYGFGQFIAAAPEMQRLRGMIDRLAITETCVLINGEYGAGRHTVGMAIHESSARKAKPFVVLPCSELPEPVLDLLLFGETQRSEGRLLGKKSTVVDDAAGGTVFLEDVDTLSLDYQQRLADFLAAYKAGKGSGPKKVRFLASSSSSLDERVKAGEFLLPLYKQIAMVAVSIAPLRKRREDILPIACSIMRDLLDDRAAAPRFTPDARALMFDYPWPGNVSELAYVMEHVVENMEEGVVSHENLPSFMSAESGAKSASELAPSTSMFQGRELRKFLSSQIKKS